MVCLERLALKPPLVNQKLRRLAKFGNPHSLDAVVERFRRRYWRLGYLHSPRGARASVEFRYIEKLYVVITLLNHEPCRDRMCPRIA
jgi:hypothetical protein